MSGSANTIETIPDAVAGGTKRAPRQVTPAFLRAWPLPEPSGTKYSRGQVLVAGGDRGTPGAVMLAGAAALRVGAGRLTLAVAASIAAHVAVALPECGTVELDESHGGGVTGIGAVDTIGRDLKRSDAVLVGPGLGTPEGAQRLVTEILTALPAKTPLVLDAFGATVLSQVDDATRERAQGRLALTPNSNELAFLLGVDGLEDDAVLDGCLELSKKYSAAVACNQWIVEDGKVWEITTGDTGLGTSGSGDVVAGAVVGLLGRGAGLAQALTWGKYLHAASGDTLAAEHGRVGYLAGEVCRQLPRTLSTLRGD